MSLLVFVLAVTAVHSAADASKIGDLLSPVDRAFEAVSSTISLGPESRSKKQLELFNERQLEAKQIVMENPRAACGPNWLASGSHQYQNLLTALTLSQRHLAKAEAEAMQIGQLSAKENALASIAESINYQLRVWNSVSPFVPKEGESGVLQSSFSMLEVLYRALAQLPETRQTHVKAQLNVDPQALFTSIQLGFAECGTEDGATLDSTNTSNGATTNTGTRTSGTASTTTTGTSGTTVIRTETGVIRTVNIPFPTTFPTPTPGPTGAPTPTPNPSGSAGGLNLNVNTDMGPGLHVGLSEEQGLVVNPDLNITDLTNIGADANVNDQNIVDTNACPGIQLLGICLTR